jgi:hypothetical protein
MTRRGKVLRDTNAGPGLLVVDDTQLAFTLEKMWTSNTPPTPGMVVDVEVEGSTVVSVAAVPEGQLAREQAKRLLNGARHRTTALAKHVVANFGIPGLLAGVALVVGWFFLTVGSLTTPLGKIDFTFWQALGAINSGSEAVMRRVPGTVNSTGIYGFFALLALAGPYLRAVWKGHRAHLAGILPFVLMLLAAWKMWHLATPSADASAEFRSAISIGVGVSMSVVAALYFAFVSVRRYLAAAAAAA